jgi:anti-sigma regulatory factor (Ser/Thr protein kinase)
VNTAPLDDGSGKVETGISLNVDITERKLEEQRKQEAEESKREFYRSTILAATDGKLIISDYSEIEKMAGPSLASWTILGPEDSSKVRHGVEDSATNAGMEESRVFDLVIGVGELVANVVKHVGTGRASLHQLHDTLLFVCRDDGTGIEAGILPQATLSKGYSTIRSLGMGYKEVIMLSDRVWLATGPAGTTVAVEMKMISQTVPTEILALLDKPW